MNLVYNITLNLENPKAGNYWLIEGGKAKPIYVYTDQSEAYFVGLCDKDKLPVDYLYGFEVYAAAPKESLDNEPRNLPAAYLQSFLNDPRFDMLVNLLPDALLDKLYDRIQSLESSKCKPAKN